MHSAQQLQIELKNELVKTNQLLHSLSRELQKIKSLTMIDGELDTNVKQNASVMAELAKLQAIDIANLPPLERLPPQLNESHQTNQNLSYEQHETFRSSMDDS
ncbi:unnamed protein product [Leptosia nina]|uniref:Uncharacterized protein n=1 Tax=Leptosia nina TaxID=320188 RepID=A0AAV1K3S5_9NEOP